MTPGPPNQTRSAAHRWDMSMVAAIALAWAGFFTHNVAELPGQTITSPESLLPTSVWLATLALYVAPATRMVGAWAILVWTALNLVGGAISVLPLPFLPFEPQQTVTHYAFHGLYAATQVPLLVITIRTLRSH